MEPELEHLCQPARLQCLNYLFLLTIFMASSKLSACNQKINPRTDA
ncbi:hypothetical protein Hanom_Chr04g00380801 [Helianthus anomalus]